MHMELNTVATEANIVLGRCNVVSKNMLWIVCYTLLLVNMCYMAAITCARSQVRVRCAASGLGRLAICAAQSFSEASFENVGVRFMYPIGCGVPTLKTLVSEPLGA